MDVAQEILRQLGGRRFIVMTGAKNLVSDRSSLKFHLPRTPGFVKDGINLVIITLTGNDDYTIEFYKVKGVDCKRLATVEGVYNDNLQRVFSNRTGLDTHL